jgi:hypothetical protein
MSRLAYILLSFSLITFKNFTANTQTTRSTFEKELEQLSELKYLPEYRPNSYVAMESSYDTTGGNDDGFSGRYSFLRKESENRLVIADLKGPGVIQRIWTPTPSEDTIQFYFDGETDPRISIRFIDLFSSQVYPFESPLVGNEVGGYYCYLPIPYEKSCKIVYLGKRIQFHQIQHRSLPDNPAVKSFSLNLSSEEQTTLQNTLKRWEDYNPLKLIEKNKVRIIEKEILIGAGETLKLAEINEGGRIVRMEFQDFSEIYDPETNLIFRAKWDDDEDYAINAPMRHLFGYAFRKTSMRSMPIGKEGDLHYINFPMPFDQSADMELVYVEEQGKIQPEVRLTTRIYVTQAERDGSIEGKLYTCWRREKPEIGTPYSIFKHKGKGHYVGTILMCQGIEENLDGHISTIFFEGDDITTIDGEQRMHGTGSEDYFNGGWYAVGDRWDKAYSLQLHGCLGYSIPLARTGGYRFLIGDKESFEKSFELTIEHGPENNNWKVDYASVAFYYGDAPSDFASDPTLDLTSVFKPPREMELLPMNNFSFQSFGFPFDDFTLERKRLNGKSVYVMHSYKGSGYVKTDLQVPLDGEYELYLSYFKSPESGTFQVYQRQKPVSEKIDIHSADFEYINKQHVGKISIIDEEAPLTFRMQGEEGKCDFILERIHLIRSDLK